MKKQIFILAFLVVATFATTTAFGQAVAGSAPRPLSCVDDALHPIAGRLYSYIVTGEGTDFTWWATKDAEFIKMAGTTPTTNILKKLEIATGDLLTAGTSYGVSSTTASVDINWSSKILAGTEFDGTGTKKPTFVVALNSGGCANNLKVYQIAPINGFTVDIKNIEQTKVPTISYTDAVSTCLSPIASAIYGGSTGITYNYGTNVLYYEVVAANFSEFWTATFKIDGLQTKQTATVEWTYDKTLSETATYTSLGAISGDGTLKDIATTAKVLIDAATSTTNGVSIYLRVTVNHGKFEGTTDNPITIEVNGFNAYSEEDVDNATCAAPAANFEDLAVQTLTKRQIVTSATPLLPSGTGLFVPAVN